MNRRLPLTSLTLTLALGACECGSPELVALRAQAELAADRIDFGEVPLGAERTLSVELSNPGSAGLEVAGVSLDPSASVFEVTVTPNPVPARGVGEIAVRFRPVAEQSYRAQARLEVELEEGAPPQVELVGRGVFPLITFAPNSLDFGAVPPGDERVRQLSIHNSGEYDQAVSLALEGEGATHYRLEHDGPDGAVTVPRESGVSVTVRYAPVWGGTHEAWISATYCGEGCGATIGLYGRSEAPRVQVEPLLIDFGILGPGGVAAQRFVVRNVGFGVLEVSGVELSQGAPHFSLVEPGASFSLAVGAEAEVEVRFNPQQSGQLEGRVVVRSDDAATPEGYVALVGRLSGAELEAVPALLEFGVVREPGPHTRHALLVNRGDTPAIVDSLTLVNAEGFEIGAAPPLPFTVEGGGVVSVALEFAPSAPGVHFGQLRVTSDVEASPLIEIALAGTWTQSDCALVPTSDAVRFGNVLIGSSSTRSLVLRNQGSAACEVAWIGFSPIHINDPSISLGYPVGWTVQPGDSLEVEVEFAPAAAGSAKAVIEIELAGADAPVLMVGVTGRGARVGLVAAPPSLDFGVQPVSCGRSERAVSLRNVGQTLIHVAPVRLEPWSSPAFSITGGNLSSPVLPGSAPTVVIGFAPNQAALHTGALVVDTVPEEASVIVPLTGEGVPVGTVEVSERFDVPAVSKVDVLFVIDNSGSMYDNQDNLASNFSHFIQYADFRGMQVDFQIGVTTTDTDEGGEQGRLISAPKILTRSTPGLDAAFAAAARVGVTGSPMERGLDAAFRALSPPLIDDPAYNQGLLRPDAALAVVVVSDEDDSSPLSVDFYIGFLEGLKGSASVPLPVVFNAVTGGPTGCGGSTASAHPAPRYDAAVSRSGGSWMDICAPDWGAQLESLGASIFLARARFALDANPDPASLRVFVNGTEVDAASWSYDPNSRTVTFDQDALPAPGDEVEVRYVIVC